MADGAQLSAAQINHLVALYDGEIAFTDQQIGRLMERLRQLGLDDNTLVILTADHGESFAEHDTWFAGSSLYNATTRVPMIVSFPNRLPRQRAMRGPGDERGPGADGAGHDRRADPGRLRGAEPAAADPGAQRRRGSAGVHGAWRTARRWRWRTATGS